MGAKPCPMTTVEQRTLFIIIRLEKNCPRWRRLSSAAAKEAVKLLLTSKKPKHLNGFDKVVCLKIQFYYQYFIIFEFVQ
jgi:hypothetical protein